MPHNQIIQDTVLKMKNLLENAITTCQINGDKRSNGLIAKESLIRSKVLINLLHESVKRSLESEDIITKNIFPPINKSKPEIKLAGFLKKKDQDICVIPNGVPKQKTKISWGPLQFEDEYDLYGKDFTEQTLVINVRSQLSSLAKNSDTLFERTFAESTNLHTLYPQIVLGDVYLIPVFEYDQSTMKNGQISFIRKRTNLEKYISFFNALNNRKYSTSDIYKYEKCALVIVDFSQKIPKIYNSTKELLDDKLISSRFNIELSNLSYSNFFKDILNTYSDRFDIKKIKM